MNDHQHPSGGATSLLDPLGAAFAFLLLRIWLGFRSLIAGIEKFSATVTVQRPLLDEFGEEDISGAMVSVKEKVYGLSHYEGIPGVLYDRFAAEPLMPTWALGIYGGVLGPALIILGIALLLGAAPRIVLLASGLLYTSLTFGLILLNESGGVAWLATHVLMFALALLLVRHNRWAVFNRY